MSDAAARTLAEVLRRRYSRRGVLGSLAAGAALTALPRFASADPAGGERTRAASFDFEPVSLDVQDGHRVAAGYEANVLLRWGDPVAPGARAFDPKRVEALSQAKQFGVANDFTAYLPLPLRSTNSDHGLLCVNHEHADARMMWADEELRGSTVAGRIRTEMAAVGHSVVEVLRREGACRWVVKPDSRYARRISATTPMSLAGPVRGHVRVRTSQDPTGTRVLGTFANCAGGTTPWGTVLTAEENFEEYFSGTAPAEGPERRNHERYRVGLDPTFRWHTLDPRFDLAKEPREANRFGWVVELDPYEPSRPPVKRTALGRFKHEGATVVLDPDGRVVVYSGDDEVFEYLYRFVSHGRYDPERREANRDLLDSGTLYVARFEPNGRCHWIPLVFGTGPLTPRNGFGDQGDVLIEARRAADLLGATALDRPEDVEVDPITGRVYLMLTNNAIRAPSRVDGPNPRAFNLHGHVLELRPPAPAADVKPLGGASPRRQTALVDRWEVYLLGGEPREGRPSNPDNAAFDPKGRLWIATDQGFTQATRGVADGLWAMETRGPERGRGRLFFACPRGAELCGPSFTPDGRTLFVAVQHPGSGFVAPGRPPARFSQPSTRWPDFEDDVPARCSIVAISRPDGAVIGG